MFYLKELIWRFIYLLISFFYTIYITFCWHEEFLAWFLELINFYDLNSYLIYTSPTEIFIVLLQFICFISFLFNFQLIFFNLIEFLKSCFPFYLIFGRKNTLVALYTYTILLLFFINFFGLCHFWEFLLYFEQSSLFYTIYFELKILDFLAFIIHYNLNCLKMAGFLFCFIYSSHLFSYIVFMQFRWLIYGIGVLLANVLFFYNIADQIFFLGFYVIIYEILLINKLLFLNINLKTL